jgi:hypothetical protein
LPLFVASGIALVAFVEDGGFDSDARRARATASGSRALALGGATLENLDRSAAGFLK